MFINIVLPVHTGCPSLLPAYPSSFPVKIKEADNMADGTDVTVGYDG